MLKNPKILEINTRVWIKQFGDCATLSSIPDSFLEETRQLGFDIIWFMGIWKTCTKIIDECCFTVDLISSYNKSLKDWKKEDVIGSPYSIDEYEINPLLGNTNDLTGLKKRINRFGMKLFLDFVPNHFGADSRFIKANPEVFLQADEDFLQRDNLTFFRHSPSGNVFAHGRDPFFLPWRDTIQVNYFNHDARKFMIDQLFKLGELCDGVRCDMAMLPLNNVFHNTWLGVLSRQNYNKPKDEFWEEAVSETKRKHPGFIFLGEAYWDLEYNLQQLGFDYTYDKRLTDRLAADAVTEVKSHLHADYNFQLKCARFIENHDEERAVTKFGKEKSMAAAVVLNTINGMKLFYEGQMEGRRIKLPVQLGRMPAERTSERVKKFYRTLLRITSHNIFREGNWYMLDPVSSGEGNESYKNIFAWKWELNKQMRIVVVNYSSGTSQCRLRFQIQTDKETVILDDLLNNESFIRNVDEIKTTGLFVELKGFHSHIFDVIL
jgi:glycosidase